MFAALAALVLSSLDARAAEETPQSLQKQCDAKNWRACSALGYRYEQGEGVLEDLAKAAALYERACNANFGKSCTSLGFLLSGDKLRKDTPKAVRLYTRACDLKDGMGCYFFGQMYQSGDGVTKDIGRAVKLFEQACDLEWGDACFELHMMLDKGDEIPKDPKRSDAYYERGCDLYALLCVMGFDEFFDPQVAKCEKGDAAACYDVGHAHLRGEAYLTADEVTSAEYLLKACNGGVPAACGLLGWVYDHGKQIPRDASKAAALYQKSCTGGYPYGCQQLGTLYLLGEGVALDARRGTDLLREACNANTPDVAGACALLAVSYEEGSGVPRDPARARILGAKACRLGEKASCAAATSTSVGCVVTKVAIGVDTLESVKRDVARRGGTTSAGTNNGKPTLNAMSGDYPDAGPTVMAVNYTFETTAAAARLIEVTIVNHADSLAEFEKVLAARQAVAISTPCTRRLTPVRDTRFIYETWKLAN